MAGELAPLSAALVRCKVGIDEPEAADVLTLLRVVSDEVRRYTRRQFEGVLTAYAEVLDTRGVADFNLTHAPVDTVLSVKVVHWDGTEDDIYAPEPVIGGGATTLAAQAAVGATNLRVTAVTNIVAGDLLWMGTGASQEVVKALTVGTAGAGGTGITVTPALAYAHASASAVVEVLGSTYWRLVDAERGRIERLTGERFVRVSWLATGVVPVAIAEATLDWVSSRWAQRERSAGQSSYSTGADSESWDLSKAGHPPPDTARTLAHYWQHSQPASLVV